MTSIPDFRTIIRHPAYFLACGFGSGLLRPAPGTFGTLAALPLYALIANQPLSVYLSIILLSAIIGIGLCHITARDFALHDPGFVVWDEIVGYGVTMIAAPQGWVWMLLGFGLFRLFDIWKPWPIDVIDRRLHGGLGIMCDDWLAGGYAFLCLQALAMLFHLS